MLLPDNVIVQGQLLPQATNYISDVWIQLLWGEEMMNLRTNQPRLSLHNRILFNESCSLDPRESPGSARLSIWMLFCTDVLTCSPLCLQVKITHVAYCYSFYPPQLNWNGRCRRINLCARRSGETAWFTAVASILATGHTWISKSQTPQVKPQGFMFSPSPFPFSPVLITAVISKLELNSSQMCHIWTFF